MPSAHAPLILSIASVWVDDRIPACADVLSAYSGGLISKMGLRWTNTTPPLSHAALLEITAYYGMAQTISSSFEHELTKTDTEKVAAEAGIDMCCEHHTGSHPAKSKL
jgi:hypothetical protein